MKKNWWNYSQVAPRSWEWPYHTEGDHGTIHLAVSPKGLVWSGDTNNPQWAGYFTIRFQSFEEFLKSGPPAAAFAPTTQVHSIREHIEALRLPGAPTMLDCLVFFDPWRLRKLRSLTFGLNHELAFSAKDRTGSGLHERLYHVFSGTVPAGRQKLMVAWETYSGYADKFHSFSRDSLEVDVSKESQMTLVIRISDKMELSLEQNPKKIKASREPFRIGYLRSKPPLRRILKAIEQWSWAGDAEDHGSDEAARQLRRDAVWNLEEAFLRAPTRMRNELREVWNFVEAGEAEGALAGYQNLREKVLRLLGKGP